MTVSTTQKIFTPDFVLACFAHFAFGFVFYLLIPTLPIYLSQLGSTEVEIGVLIGIFTLSSVFIRPYVGRTLLRIPEKTFMVIGALLYTFTSVAYLFALPFWPFLIVRVVQGVGYAFFQTASITLIANMSAESHRGQSVSYFILAFNISGAIAPSLGIFLVNHFSFTLFFLVCLGLSLCLLFIASQLGKRQVTPLLDSSTQESFFLSREALPPSIISSFSFLIWGALAAFFPLYAINHGVANPGLFFTTIAMMLILGRALGGKMIDLYSREKIILPSLVAYIVSVVILAFSKSLPMFILVAAILGIGHAFLIPALVVHALDHVGSSPGPAMGTFHAVMDLGMCVGPVAMGIILQMTSYPAMFLCLAFIGIINLNYFFFFVRKKK